VPAPDATDEDADGAAATGSALGGAITVGGGGALTGNVGVVGGGAALSTFADESREAPPRVA
jgi:hypothetical protein